MLGRALTSVFWGKVADRYGRKPVIIIGTSTMCEIGFPLPAFVVSFCYLYLICCLQIYFITMLQSYFQHSLWS